MSTSFVITNALVYHTDIRDFVPGSVAVEGDRITAVLAKDEALPAGFEVIDAEGKYLIPGLVDVHTHGRIGYDFDSATTEQMREMKLSYAKDGVTTVLPTIASAPMERILTSIDNIKEAGYDGMHLEGRYLNPKRRGAHRPDLLFPLDKDELSMLLDRMEPLLVHITCAAELPGGEEFVKTAVSRGATVSLGHTDASYEEAMNAVSWGVTAFTHTFNAMRPIHHREPGPITAALTTDDAYAEIISDGFHLNPAIVKLVYRAKRPNHLVLITDSMSATHCKDGEYSIAGEKVFVVDGKAVNEDGNIAGSTIDLYSAIRNLMKFAGVSYAEAVSYATIMPARMVGLDKITGSIEAGKRADLVLTDPETYDVKAVFQAGSRI